MLDKINALAAEISALTASSAAEVEELRIKYLSKKGLVSALFNDFRTVPADQKREIGQAINDLKNLATDKINALRDALSCSDACDNSLDLTRSAAPIPLGTRHPLSIVREEIIDIFRRLGFTIAEGPEIEDDWHVFSSLNFAEDHPARDMQDTFFINRMPPLCVLNLPEWQYTQSVQLVLHRNKALTPQIDGFLQELRLVLGMALSHRLFHKQT